MRKDRDLKGYRKNKCDKRAERGTGWGKEGLMGEELTETTS